MVDPITLEVLRCKLEAIADDGAKTVQRTAISPVVADAGDCSCAVYDANGELIVGGGVVAAHFHTGVNGVRKIRAVHGDTVADGDIFLVNDPYAGGGFHAQDVFIHMPVFVDGVLSCWVGASAHMMDMGGSVMGSFVPNATECYQEALRLPPVRVYNQGEEQHDIWAIIRNNIRISNIVEMDMRALIAGATVVRNQLVRTIGEYGPETFFQAVAQLADLTEREVRRRIAELEPGVYKAQSWSEWTDELFNIPCTLTVSHDKLVFDFTHACPQSQHYFNSKPYVVESLLGVALAAYTALDLAINEGIFRAFEIRCRPGSILDAEPPAPIGAPHLDVGQTAVEVAMYALNLAIAASPDAAIRRNMAGPSGGSGWALHTMACTGLRGQPDGWLLLDSAYSSASAGHDRDSTDLWYELVGKGAAAELVDIEVLEAWYPIQVDWRRPRRGAGGAGEFRSGGAMSMSYRIAGTSQTVAAIMGNRERVPIAGHAGGLPGATTRLAVRRIDGRVEPVACHQQDVVVKEGEALIFECSGGGGWGDPLQRDPAAVEADVRHLRLTAEDALAVHGVVVGDAEATHSARSRALAGRLAAAGPAKRPLKWTAELRRLAEGIRAPLYIGVEQHGAVAVSTRSGAPLAVSPESWADGCPVIRGFLPSTPDVSVVAYLEPETGHLLMVGVVAAGAERSFEATPDRWAQAAAQATLPAIAAAE
jgi:N-methylhydantoinase B